MIYEKITEQELDKMTLENGTTPNYTCDKYDVKTKTYINLEIKKTADEVYQEWSKNKDNPPAPQPTPEEILRAKLIKDNASMQLQLAQQQQINANLLSQIAKLGGAK